MILGLYISITLFISISGCIPTLEPITSNAEAVAGLASIQEVNKAELYLESLTDEELANLCETTNLLIETKEKEITEVIKKV